MTDVARRRHGIAFDGGKTGLPADGEPLTDVFATGRYKRSEGAFIRLMASREGLTCAQVIRKIFLVGLKITLDSGRAYGSGPAHDPQCGGNRGASGSSGTDNGFGSGGDCASAGSRRGAGRARGAGAGQRA